jgi:hypothetical protein
MIEKKNRGTLFSCQSENSFSGKEVILEMPREALYEDLDFVYSAGSKVTGTYSSLHHIHNELTPIQSYCQLSIKTNGLPSELSSKAVIVKVEDSGRFSSRGGKWEEGFVTTKIREFGDYTVTVDTTAPVIRPVNIVPGKNVSKQQSIVMKISDNLSGIRYYRGTINNQWILMDYDAKSNQLTYLFDERIKAGKNTFKLVVKDDVGNESSYQATITK